MTSEKAPGISIVIPSWNGLHLLRENLPSVLEAARTYARHSGGATEIIVVDDGSRDETAQRIPAEFSEVRLLVKERNEGFAAACNTGFRNCRYPLVALMNNDLAVERDYLLHHAGHFREARVFAVTSKVFEWKSSLFAAGGRFGRFRRGFWSVYFNYDVLPAAAADWIDRHRLLSAYAIGGFSTYHGEKLKELGGFNELLSPFHWEDVDLSYRGWKRGWEIHYEPRSVAFHRASSTIGSYFETRAVEAVSLRNRLLFHWINLHSPGFLLRHLLMLGALTATRILVSDLDFYRALWAALRQLPTIRALRKQERRQARCSDREISRLLKRFYRSAPLQIYYNQQEVLARHPDARRF